MDIRCRKCDCQNNNKQTCKLKSFDISQKAACQNFECSATKSGKDCVNIFEQTIELAPYITAKKKKVRCGAESCVFNDQTHCISNGLTILNDKKETATCMNYFER